MTPKALVVTGAGGVGKTTVSAALAVAAARRGLRTLVVTVDPARRLAAALGLKTLGAEPQPLPDEPLLWAAMLDATASWEAIALRHADPAVARRLVRNEFFVAASNHFPASQSYAAAEEATNFLEARVWDLVVVDTPPAAGGIDFFTAPGEMADLVGGRLLRWMTLGRIPGRRMFFDRAGRPALRLADQVLGANLLERVADFLFDLRTTYDGVSRRAQEIETHLRRAKTLVVTTADPAAVREAIRFFRELPEIAGRPVGVVFNRTLPESWGKGRAGKAAPDLVENLRRWGSEAQRQTDVRAEFSARYRTLVATLPWRSTPPNRLETLADLAEDMAGITLEDLIGVGK